MIRSDILILRLTPFGESDLILAGLTPEYGRLDFILKGAKRTGRKQYPCAGLFRVVSGDFREPDAGKGGLLSLRSPVLMEEFDGIASHTNNYLAACEYVKRLLRFTTPMVPCPETCASALLLFRRLAEQPSPQPFMTLAILVQVREAGLLPAAPPEKAALQEQLVLAGLGQAEIPILSGEYWDRISRWAEHLM